MKTTTYVDNEGKKYLHVFQELKNAAYTFCTKADNFFFLFSLSNNVVDSNPSSKCSKEVFPDLRKLYI